MSLTINSQYDPGCHAARPRDRRLRFGMEIWDGNTQAPLRARHSLAPPGGVLAAGTDGRRRPVRHLHSALTYRLGCIRLVRICL